MKFKHYDIHAHLNFPDFDNDRGEVVARANEAGVGVINVGNNVASSKWALDLADQYGNGMKSIVGLHPVDASNPYTPKGETQKLPEDFDIHIYEELAKHPSVVGIGETGLDYFHCDESYYATQERVLRGHLDLATKLGLPVMFHIRPSKGSQDAYEDTFKVLAEYSKINGDIHFFAGDMETARKALDLGLYISFTGVITFAREFQELVEYVPLDRIMAETDCPFVAPRPYRGKRNEPSFVVSTIEKIAEIKNVPFDTVAGQLRENVRKLWGI